MKRAMAAYKVVMVRHGESLWNKANKFTGWYDADLSELGVQEAIDAGKLLKENGYKFDIAFTSVLKRAIKTLYLMQEEMDAHWIPVVRHWRLNERMYGGLQGLNKAETAKLHGEDQVKQWRRSYGIPPPPVELTSEHWPGTDDKYKLLDRKQIPLSECLKDTVNRVLPFWNDQIVPAIKGGQRVIISAHGNSLRALAKYLEDLSEDDVMALNIPTGLPLVYELDEDLNHIKHYYLASAEQVQAGLDKVAAQGKAK